jgi:hypothetical protein
MIYILKYFSADGNYEVTLMTKATVYYDGRVIWEVRLKNILYVCVFFLNYFIRFISHQPYTNLVVQSMLNFFHSVSLFFFY